MRLTSDLVIRADKKNELTYTRWSLKLIWLVLITILSIWVVAVGHGIDKLCSRLTEQLPPR